MDEIAGLLRTADGTFTVTITRHSEESPSTPKRKTFPKHLRIRLLNLQEYRCAICQGAMGYYDTHIDHIVPIRAGGTDDISNLQLTHMHCNLRKGQRHDPGQEVMPWA